MCFSVNDNFFASAGCRLKSWGNKQFNVWLHFRVKTPAFCFLPRKMDYTLLFTPCVVAQKLQRPEAPLAAAARLAGWWAVETSGAWRVMKKSSLAGEMP
jgi:hypothetical protein